MNRMNFWDFRKNDDYMFIDNSIREYFDIGGVSVFLHKYLGPIDQIDTDDPSMPSAAQSQLQGPSQIEDLFFQENRDRNYDPSVYELKCIYSMMDIEFDIRQFGMFLEADSFYVSFHLNDILEKIGRKLMTGDVLEMLHMRDDALLDPDAPAINKFYQITDVNRSANGWSVTYRPHILRVKIAPLTDSQEFSQILDQPASSQAGGDGLDGTALSDTGLTLGNIMSDYNSKIAIADASLQAAAMYVPYRNFDTTSIWIVPGSETRKEYPWIYTGDGIPPNQSVKGASGTQLPDNPSEGDYFLKIPEAGSDVDVNIGIPVLYQFTEGLWLYQEVDLRPKWEAAQRILNSFITNNTITTLADGTTFTERQPISKALLRPDSW
jgi:hypothetical protein